MARKERVMGKIIPRWEFRSFQTNFGKAEELIKKHEVTRIRESSEVYILSQKSNDNTKVRDELMDIKTPLRVNVQTKLEQWTVLMKAGFPIHINELALVYKAFGLQMPYCERDEYTYQEYIETLIKPNPDLQMVKVYKNRYGYLVDNCIIEIAEVKFDEIKKKTIAVEHMDPELVQKTVAKLGLLQFENINYIKEMKRTFGMNYI